MHFSLFSKRIFLQGVMNLFCQPAELSAGAGNMQPRIDIMHADGGSSGQLGSETTFQTPRVAQSADFPFQSVQTRLSSGTFSMNFRQLRFAIYVDRWNIQADGTGGATCGC